jgi:hypothetical protein
MGDPCLDLVDSGVWSEGGQEWEIDSDGPRLLLRCCRLRRSSRSVRTCLAAVPATIQTEPRQNLASGRRGRS